MPVHAPVGIVLAAGKGTRMKSDLPKALHLLAGLPMVDWVGRAMRGADIERVILVVGHEGDRVRDALGDRYEYVWQREQLGTGHAALMARDLLVSHEGPILIAPGDAPLLTAEVLKTLLEAHPGHECTFASSVIADPKGYGRVVRDGSGKVVRIVEEKDATSEERAVKEVSAAVYCFNGPSLFRELPDLSSDNAQGEFYLPEVVERLVYAGENVQAVCFDDANLLVGINDRWQLAQAEAQVRTKILRERALDGVTILDPGSTFIGPLVEIGSDTVIEASTYLWGRTRVGARCRIGPNTRVQDATIGDDCRLLMSHLDGATLGNGVFCGPFANLRPGTVLADGVKIGNFVEVKKALLDSNVSVSHLTYVGDAEIGADTNIGAGVVTCNYDGFVKNRTVIGKNAFIGSHATLIAPIEIGDGVIVAAGSTVTEDVPADAGVFGRARQETKEGWARNWREKRRPRQ